MQVPRIEKRIFSRWWVGGRGYVDGWAYLLSNGELVTPEQYRRMLAAAKQARGARRRELGPQEKTTTTPPAA